MTVQPDSDRDLILLEHLELDPDATQATLASQLGVAVGTVNWHLKRLIEKGYVKAGRVERRKLRYVITPEGLALRARLTLDYIQNSFRVYRLVRQRMLDALQEVQTAGLYAVRLNGEGDVAEICRLTCLERGVMISTDLRAPLLRVIGLKIFIEWESGSPAAQRAESLPTLLRGEHRSDHNSDHHGDHHNEQQLESGNAD
jgi:DNA-binding MarR family transcriptional regulator